MGLVVVASAVPFRAATIPFATISAHWPVIQNLLAGSLLGAWIGMRWAMPLRSETLYKVIAMQLVAIAVVLVFGHDATEGQPIHWIGAARCGCHRGLRDRDHRFPARLAGGELLILTLVL